MVIINVYVLSMLIVIMMIEFKDFVFFFEVLFFVELLNNYMNVLVIGCFFFLNRFNVVWGSCGRGGNF